MVITSSCSATPRRVWSFPIPTIILFTTEISIREVEQQYGFSASNPDFFEAVEKLPT
jgi:hypothetical protein